MENRSFDHMLGWLKSSRPDIDGLSGSEYNRVNASNSGSTPVYVSDDAFFIASNPSHSIQAIWEQIIGSNDTSANPASMNGFVQQAKAMGVDGLSKTVMSGFKPDLVPIYSEFVNEFVVMDRWFASVPALT
ncbi:non-specific phospholipase C1 [Olea europaea subsp. europaea]|uniref:Non-specific phospholipase C1 n=1 Tax=Olea europaea subsp. europaea TaxID=158383 RepID=A0A8S0V261_OLEEU|nr:non-specific phospholipase C1 [Olea europaea subsp. europaea]